MARGRNAITSARALGKRVGERRQGQASRTKPFCSWWHFIRCYQALPCLAHTALSAHSSSLFVTSAVLGWRVSRRQHTQTRRRNILNSRQPLHPLVHSLVSSTTFLRCRVPRAVAAWLRTHREADQRLVAVSADAAPPAPSPPPSIAPTAPTSPPPGGSLAALLPDLAAPLPPGTLASGVAVPVFVAINKVRSFASLLARSHPHLSPVLHASLRATICFVLLGTMG